MFEKFSKSKDQKLTAEEQGIIDGVLSKIPGKEQELNETAVPDSADANKHPVKSNADQVEQMEATSNPFNFKEVE